MTATSEVRFGADGAAKVQSYVRLTASTYIRCCTYEDAAPILTIQDGPADITITNPGRGEVTEGEVLPTWDQALDAITEEAEPWHVARFGVRFDAQGVLAGSKDASRCIGYLTKYLTKQVGDCHQVQTPGQHDHAARLAEALRYQPCSPRCANWLRYGIQPKNARTGLAPGRCKGKAHDADHLGYAGRRVLVSRKWSGKTLADHRADRKEWLLRTLGVSATDPARYAWEPVAPGDPDHMDHARRLLHAVADRARWQAALNEARRRATGGGNDPDALEVAA